MLWLWIFVLFAGDRLLLCGSVRSCNRTRLVIHICSREILIRAGPPCIGTICFALHSRVQQGLMNVNKRLAGSHTILQFSKKGFIFEELVIVSW